MWNVIGVLVTAVVLVASLVALIRPATDQGAERPYRVEALLCFALFAVGLFLRLAYIPDLLSHRLTSDEAWMARTYVSSIVHLDRVQNGATYLTHALFLDAWYRLFGLTAFAPRYLSAMLGLAGLLFTFAAVRLLLGTRIAAWTTALLAASTYGIFFSVFALETVHVLFFGPLVLFLATRWLREPSMRWSLLLGFTSAASLFTYPGLILGYAAIALGSLAALALHWLRISPALGNLPPRSPWSIVWCVMGAAPVIGAGVLLQTRLATPTAPLFRGGGALNLSFAAFEEAIPTLLLDLFVGTRTWNLPFRGTPFIDLTLWPLALLGAYLLWRRYPQWLVRGAVLSMMIVVLLVPFSGSYPGMRRGLYIILPVSVCAAVAVVELWRRFGALLGGVVVALAIAHPVYYQATVGHREWLNTNFGEDFGAPPIPDGVLVEALEQANVVMSGTEFSHEWDRLRHLHFVKLAARYGLLRNSDHTLRFVSPDTTASSALPAGRHDVVALSWRPDALLLDVIKTQKFCFKWSDLQAATGVAEPTRIHLATPEDADGDGEYVCPWSEDHAQVLRSCALLGAKYSLSRIVHGLSCLNATCDRTRTTFLWAHPGSVEFQLGKPAGVSSGDPIRLVLKVRGDEPTSRLNRLAIGGADLGLLDTARVDPNGLAVFAVPQAVQPNTDSWSIFIDAGGDPSKIGWDIEWAALISEQTEWARAPSPPPACERPLCVKRANGADICEERG